MNRTAKSFIIMLLLLLTFTACSDAERAATTTANAPAEQANANAAPASATKTPPADVVSVSASDVELAAGGSAEATVRVSVMKGYHINSNPASQYQIATQLSVESSEGVKTGKPVYPPSITKKFPFAEQPIAVYEGEAVIKLPLEAERAAAKGTRKLPAKLRVQACDEEVCYPPRNIDTSIKVNIK